MQVFQSSRPAVWHTLRSLNRSKLYIQSTKNPKIQKSTDSQAFSQDFNFFFFQFSKSNDQTIGFLDFWIFIYIFFYDSSINLLSNDVFTRSEVGTGWKYWFHFGLKIGIICLGCMAKVLAFAFVGLCLTFSPYSRATFSFFSTCCLAYFATSRIGFDFHL